MRDHGALYLRFQNLIHVILKLDKFSEIMSVPYTSNYVSFETEAAR